MTTLSSSSRSRVRKLPASAMGIVLPFLLSIVMTFVVSGVSTVLGIGLVEGLFGRWMRAWAFSWVIAFPVLLIALPIVRKVATMIVAAPGERAR